MLGDGGNFSPSEISDFFPFTIKRVRIRSYTPRVINLSGYTNIDLLSVYIPSFLSMYFFFFLFKTFDTNSFFFFCFYQ